MKASLVLLFAMMCGLAFAQCQTKICSPAYGPCESSDPKVYMGCSPHSYCYKEQTYNGSTHWGICMPYRQAGELCDESNYLYCEPHSLFCPGGAGFCTQRLEIGAYCDSTYDSCVAGSSCINATCMQLYTRSFGEECSTSDSFRMCNVDHYCKYNSTGYKYYCAARLDVGATCSSTSECKDGMMCYLSECTRYGTRAEGESCSTTRLCGHGLTCYSGTCAEPATLVVGDLCLSSSDCKADASCSCLADGTQRCLPSITNTEEYIYYYMRYYSCTQKFHSTSHYDWDYDCYVAYAEYQAFANPFGFESQCGRSSAFTTFAFPLFALIAAFFANLL